MSIDGRTALKNGESKWITSKKARQDVQIFRAKSSGILSTSKSILIDNSKLTVRINEFSQKILSKFPKKDFRHPIRIIIDSKNRIKKTHQIMNTKEKIFLLRLKPDQEIWPKNIKQVIIEPYKNNINIISMFKFLGDIEMNNIWIEAGSNLSGILLKMKLIDEIIIYIAPKILGHEAKPLFKFQNNNKLIECIQYKFLDFKKIGKDIRLKLST
ncbi:Riboflavin biosynthesis protein RibD, partial [5-amino-6-(5-phosphoribosylamino)uracil reductase] [Buchnera aphidicola (Protaphis terricola)]